MRTFLLVAMMVGLSLTMSAQHTLTVEFQGMNPHVGQMLGIRLVDKVTGAEAAKVVILEIPSPDFSVSIMALVNNDTYDVGIFADLNRNGKYDPPPADHAWTTSAAGDDNLTITFQHNLMFTDIAWPNVAPPFPHKTTVEYVGDWHNITFNTRGDAFATMVFDYDAGMMNGSITTSGAFGNPDEVTFKGSGPFDPVADSAVMNVEAPPGQLTFIRGVVGGELDAADVGVTLSFDGNYGADQMSFNYTMTGGFDAVGTFIMKRVSTTGVDVLTTDDVPSILAWPQPADHTIQMSWDPSLGAAQSIQVVNMDGSAVLTVASSNIGDGHAAIPVSTLSAGKYQAIIKVNGTLLTLPVTVVR